MPVIPALNRVSYHGYHKLQRTENYAQYLSENQHEKPYVRNITCLFLYRPIWNYCFLLSFALKVKRIRSVIKMSRGMRSRIFQSEKVQNICKQDPKLSMVWR